MRDLFTTFFRKSGVRVVAYSRLENALAGNSGDQRLPIAPRNCVQDAMVHIPKDGSVHWLG